MLIVSDVEPRVLQESVDEMHAFRGPFDNLIYEVIGVRSFDAALACVRQALDDPAGERDWAIAARIDLDASDEEGRAVVVLDDIAAG